MVPRKAILAIHFVESRGSSVNCAEDQYLIMMSSVEALHY